MLMVSLIIGDSVLVSIAIPLRRASHIAVLFIQVYRLWIIWAFNNRSIVIFPACTLLGLTSKFLSVFLMSK